MKAVERRLKVLAIWLAARLEREERDRAPWRTAIAQCDALARLVALAGAEVVRGPGPGEMWLAFERAFTERRGELDGGRLVAPGNPGASGEVDSGRDAVVDGRLALEPTCRFCEFGRLCGRAFGESP